MKSCILVREPKQQVPEAFSKLVTEKYTTCIGYACPQGETHLDTDLFPGDEYLIADSLKEIDDNYKDDQIYYHLMSGEDGEYNAESLQPFNLLVDDEQRVILSVMLCGEFPKFNEMNRDGEVFTAEYHCVNTFLKPLIDELWELCDGDMKRLMAFFDKKVQKEKIEGVLGKDATLLLIPYVGKSISFSTSKTVGKWDWGFCTTNLGYTEAGKTVPKGKLSLKEQLAAKNKGATAEHPPGGTVIPIEERYATLLKNSDSNAVAIWEIKSGKLIARPPRNSNLKSGKEWWHRNTATALPSKDDAQYAPKLFGGIPADELKPDGPIRSFLNRFEGKGVKQADSDQNQESKPEKKVPEKKPPGEFTLFIPQEQKKRFHEAVKGGRIETCTVDELKVTLQRYPLASLQLGENIEELLMWTPESWSRIGHDVGTHALICFAHELRCRLLGIAPGEKPADEETPEEQPPAAIPAEKKKLSLKEQLAAKKAA